MIGNRFLFAFWVAMLAAGLARAGHEVVPLERGRPRSNDAGTQVITGSTGTLVVPPNQKGCTTLKLFFPGHAQELGYGASVPQREEGRWARYLLGPGGNYNLRGEVDRSGCPVLILGDSQKNISTGELERLLKKTGMSNLEVLSHSGGYQGLSRSLKGWSGSLINRINKVSLLDTCYRSDLHDVLKSRIGRSKLKKICRGFTTPHNRARWQANYANFCQGTVYPRGAHKSPVRNYF